MVGCYESRTENITDTVKFPWVEFFCKLKECNRNFYDLCKILQQCSTCKNTHIRNHMEISNGQL